MSRKFSNLLHSLAERIAIPGLIRYVALLNALVFVLYLLSPGYLSMLELDPRMILSGQVWRLVTWIFIPETLSPLWIFFALLFLFYIGNGLEEGMGAAKLTLFYVSGVILCTLVNFLFGLLGDGGAVVGRANTFLNLSLLLAFATLYPDFRVLVFFFLPVRVVWLAACSGILMVLGTLGQPLVVAATLGAALLNYALFFRRELVAVTRGTKAVGFVARRIEPSHGEEALHRCASCGRTDTSHPDLEFRVTADGSEYCREHLSGAAPLKKD